MSKRSIYGTPTSSTIVDDLTSDYYVWSSQKTYDEILANSGSSFNISAITSSVIATTDNTLNLGSDTKRFNTAYVNEIRTSLIKNTNGDTNMTMGQGISQGIELNADGNGLIFPSSSNTLNFGKATNKFLSGYFNNLYADTYNSATNQPLFSYLSGDISVETSMRIDGSITPISTGNYVLGQPTKQWQGVYTTDLFCSNSITTTNISALTATLTNLTISTMTTQGNILSNGNNLYDIGSSSYKFANAYLNSINSTTITTTNIFTSTITANNLTVSNSLIPNSNNIANIGASGNNFLSAYITTLNATTVGASTVKLSSINTPANTVMISLNTSPIYRITAYSNIYPSTNNHDLGNPSYGIWNNLYVNSITSSNITNAVTITTNSITATNILCNTTATFNNVYITNGDFLHRHISHIQIDFSNFTTPYVRSHAVANTFYPLAPTTVTYETPSTEFTQNGAGLITYTGDMGIAHVALTLTNKLTSGNNVQFEYNLYVSGVSYSAGKMRQYYPNSTDNQTITLHMAPMLMNGDTIQLYTCNRTNTASLDIYSLNIFIMKMPH